MSRSGYSEDCEDNWALIRWRGMVASATRGRRGQRLLRDMLAALDAMPEKRLIQSELECSDGVCALGAVGQARSIDMSSIDPYDDVTVAATFDIASPLAREIVWENDEAGHWKETPEQRWSRMRHWVASQILPTND